MATIAATAAGASGAVTATKTTLDGSSDTFAYNAGKTPVLILENPTGGAISPTIDGDGASSVAVAGVGSVDISGGFAVGSIGAGAVVSIRLATIEKYLAGTIDITGGTGLEATLLEF